ncbi:iron ABC transporter permease [Paenalkalicoccus suaedae]|uniref:Iron ABC transporter permease n=1 Tax=Paenalkalicoccus suaedae TaxID=2592382 RepID=A0A859FI99_9BACI|nr:iron ABC transporter permease [Paenalkalicoccus suaedae]QKS72560.1 iron ABC transporter permease [Paenalkalicoccus suaedae]
MLQSKSNRDIWSTMTIVIFSVYALFLLYPLFSLLITSVQDPGSGSFSLRYFSDFFSSAYYMEALWNSFKVTIAVTAISALVAVPLAYIMTTVKIKGAILVTTLIIISSVSPPFIGAYSWILLLGRNGVITNFFQNTLGIPVPDIYGFTGISLVLVLQLFPLVYIYTLGALRSVDNSLIEAAESMQCTGLQKMYKIIVPLIIPTLLAGSLLVFMRALSDFGTPMLIGEGYRTIPVLIFNEFISEVGGDAGFAAAISVIVVIIASLVFLLQKYISKKKSFTMSALKPIEAKNSTGVANIVAHTFVYGVTAIALLPRIYVIYTSFLETSGTVFVQRFSLDSYFMSFDRLGSSIQITFMLAIAAMVIIVIMSVFIAYLTVRRPNKINDTLDTVSMFPFIVPGSILGIALLASFNSGPILLGGTAFIMIISFAIRRLPYTIRSSAAILNQISKSVEEASISLGASNLKTFVKITLPMMASGIIAGSILSWINIFSELSTSIILYTGATRTMSIAIYTEVLRGSYGTAAALSTILTIVTVLSLLVFFKVTGKREVAI